MQRTFVTLGALLGSGLMFLAACSSSSSGPSGVDGGSHGDDGGSSGSSSGSSGASSGGSSSGASSGSGSGGSSSGGSSSGSSSGGSSGGDTMLVTGRSALDGLMLIGSKFYWIEPQSGIFSAPVAGGAAQSVYANANVNQALGSDGTHLFFTQTSGTGSEVDMVNLDGTGEQAIATGVFALSAANDSGPQIFVVNGTVYVNGTSNIFTIPLNAADGGADGGGMGTLLTGASVEVQALFAADSANIYFSDFTGNLYVAPLSTGTPSMILASSISNAPTPGDLAMVGGSAYALVAGSAIQTVNLMKSTGGAAATVVASYMMENGNRAGVLPDGNGGLYELVGGDQPGIYDAPVATGTQTGVDTGMYAINLGNMVGALHASDATHVYYADVGGGMFSIWSHTK